MKDDTNHMPTLKDVNDGEGDGNCNRSYSVHLELKISRADRHYPDTQDLSVVAYAPPKGGPLSRLHVELSAHGARGEFWSHWHDIGHSSDSRTLGGWKGVMATARPKRGRAVALPLIAAVAEHLKRWDDAAREAGDEGGKADV